MKSNTRFHLFRPLIWLLTLAMVTLPAVVHPARFVSAAVLETAASTPTDPAPKSEAKTDEGEAYRHSNSVQWLAKILHINVETAAKIFEDLNSGVVILAIAFFLVRTLPKAFRKRRETISAALLDARTATEQANERLSVVEQRLSRLDTEIESIRQQAERDGVQDEVRIRQSLEEERRRIVQSSQHEIDSAGVAAQRKLKQFAAELAIERATRDLRLTPEADRLLVSDFGKQLQFQKQFNGDIDLGGRN